MGDKIKKEPRISDYYDGFEIFDLDAPMTEEQKRDEENLKACIELQQEKYRKEKEKKPKKTSDIISPCP